MPHFNPDIIEPTDFNIMVAPVTGRTRIVEIIYNGSGIHRITGPVPIMTINKTFERNGAGTIELIKSAINLTGKIIRNGAESDSDIDPPGTGLPSILGAISNLEKIFKLQDFGNLDINGRISGNAIRYRYIDGTGSGASVKIADISTSRVSA